MRKLIAGIVLALALPSLALAAKPADPGKSQQQHGKAVPRVMYVLRGVLSGYTPATDSTPGSISILVKHANRHGAALKTLTSPLVFTLTTTSKVRIGQGRTTIADGDQGIVKVRAPKAPRTTSATDLATLLQAQPQAFQVLDQRAAG
jgi:hypothetical protein